MYTLRRITEREAIEININLGDSYTVVRKDLNLNEFKRAYEVVYNIEYDKHSKEDEEGGLVYAFVSSNGAIYPLFKNQYNFIMTDSGKTFDNLSIKR